MPHSQNNVDLFLFYFDDFEKKPLISKFNIVVNATKNKILEKIRSGELNGGSIEDVIINAIKVGRGVPNPDFDLADKYLWLTEPTKNTQAEIDSINRILEYHKSECSNFITEKVRDFISSKIDDAICLGFTVASGVPAGIVCEAVKSSNDLLEIIRNGLDGSIRDDWDKFFSCLKIGDVERMLKDSMYGISGAITGPMISAPPPPSPQNQSPASNYRDTPSHGGRSLGEQRSPDVTSGSGHVNINDSPRGPKPTISRDVLLNKFAAEKMSVTVNVDYPPFMSDYACAIVAAACCKIAIKRIIELKNAVPPPPPPPPPPPRPRYNPESGEPRGPRGRDGNH